MDEKMDEKMEEKMEKKMEKDVKEDMMIAFKGLQTTCVTLADQWLELRKQKVNLDMLDMEKTEVMQNRDRL